MPNHSPEHLRRITDESRAARRTTKIAQLIKTSPPLHPEQADRLRHLIDGIPALIIKRGESR